MKVAVVKINIKLPRGFHYIAIPWDVHEKVYQECAFRTGTKLSIEKIAQKGGFSYYEITEFYPEWDGVVLIAKQYSDNVEDWTKVQLKNLL